MNILVLEGRMTKDFVKKNEMAYSSIAVNGYKGSMFVDVSCFGKVADYCVEHIKKGTKVVVQGELTIYEKGDKKYVSCSVRSIVDCAKREQSNEPVEPNVEQEQVEDVVSIDDTDDLPF